MLASQVSAKSTSFRSAQLETTTSVIIAPPHLGWRSHANCSVSEHLLGAPQRAIASIYLLRLGPPTYAVAREHLDDRGWRENRSLTRRREPVLPTVERGRLSRSLPGVC